MSLRVIVAQAMAEPLQARLAQLDQPIDVSIVSRSGDTADNLSDATVFFRAFIGEAAYERVLQAAPRLQWVHTGSAGVDGLITRSLQERSITLTNSAGVYAIPIAEWVLHALLSIVKQGPHMWQAQQQRQWDDSPQFEELSGKTITILGAGGIGSEIAKRAAAFDMRVWGVNRSGKPVPHVERIIREADWRSALPETDFLVVATPLTDATRQLIAAQELGLLPKHAWLINIARGAIIDEAALIEALHEKTIAGAALDTFEQEPLPQESPLWTMPNVIISPHHSGSSPRSTDRVLDLFLDNLQRFMRGGELRNIVDFDAGY